MVHWRRDPHLHLALLTRGGVTEGAAKIVMSRVRDGKNLRLLTAADLANMGIDAGDAAKLLDFIVLTIEARRDDDLKKIDFSIEPGPAQLWALPATGGSGRWKFVTRS